MTPPEESLAALTLNESPEPNKPASDSNDDLDPQRIITTYMVDNSQELQRLNALRKQGWQNPEGDKFFERNRKVADSTSKDKRTAWYFFNMMLRIATEMHECTSALTIPDDDECPIILDLCMNPGGFLQEALKHTPRATAMGLSLDPRDGGHKSLMAKPFRSRVQTHYVDVTMLAADMMHTPTAAEVVPPDHPEADAFPPRPMLPVSPAFSLVFCDGQVLRTHRLPEYREATEARRLTAAQLVLGLERLRPGGTLVVLMHRLEVWRSVQTIYAMSRFAEVTLHKPTVAHTKRSSFYLVARNVQADRPEARQAIDRWREAWRAATFPDDADDSGVELSGDDAPWTAGQIIREFGPELLRMAGPVWKTQADGLADAPFITGMRA